MIATFGVDGVSECCTQINYSIPYLVILVHCIHTGGGGGGGGGFGCDSLTACAVLNLESSSYKIFCLLVILSKETILEI